MQLNTIINKYKDQRSVRTLCKTILLNRYKETTGANKVRNSCKRNTYCCALISLPGIRTFRTRFLSSHFLSFLLLSSHFDISLYKKLSFAYLMFSSELMTNSKKLSNIKSRMYVVNCLNYCVYITL